MRTELTVEQALEQGKTLPFAMITEYSQVTLGRTPAEINEDELLEARFFNENTEVRVYKADDKLKARIVTRGNDDTVLEKTYQTQGENRGSKVSVRRYLTFDEDGQAGVAATCLCGWEE